MIDLAVLEQYFPEPNKPIKEGTIWQNYNNKNRA
jgi:hypothetical protein